MGLSREALHFLEAYWNFQSVSVEPSRSDIAAAFLPSACRYGCCPDGVSAAQGPNNVGCPQHDSDVHMRRNQPAAAVPTVSTKILWVLAAHYV